MKLETNYETNTDIYMAVLQIRSTTTRPRLPSLTALLLIKFIRSLLPEFSTIPVLLDNGENNHAALINMQQHNNKM